MTTEDRVATDASTVDVSPVHPNGRRIDTQILAISGSLRHDSYNTRLVRFLVDEAPVGTRVDQYHDLRELPPYDPDDDAEDPPASVAELRRQVVRADGLLLVTPEYNYAVPGQLKNAIDWLSWPAGGAPLTGKPVAIAGATITASGTAYAQLALRQILLATQSPVVLRPEVRISQVHERFNTSGELIDSVTRQLLLELMEALTLLVHDPAGLSGRFASHYGAT